MTNNLTPLDNEAQGMYYSKKRYEPYPFSKYDETQKFAALSHLEENPLWIETYWKAWWLAFMCFYEPTEGSDFVSQFLN